MKRIFYWLPEMIVFILAVVCQNCSVLRFLPFLLVIAAAKGFWLSRSGFDEALCSRKYLFLPAASLLLELGGLLRVFAGASTEWGLLSDAAVCLVGIAAGCGVLRLLEKHGSRLVKHSGILWLTLAVTAIAGLLIWHRFADTEAGNGTYNWLEIGGVSIQLSELLKLWAVGVFALTAQNYRNRPETIIVFYIFLLSVCLGMGCILNEWGTAMHFGFFLLAVNIPLARTWNGTRRNPIWTSRIVPLGMVSLTGLGLFTAKRVLWNMYASGNADVISLYERINSDGEQILAARDRIEQAALVSMNLNQYDRIAYGDASSVLTDYCFASMCGAFGWLIPASAVLLMTAGLAAVFILLCRQIRTSPLSAAGAASAVMLLIQLYMTTVSVLGWCPFSGLTLPFASPGKSSLFVCSVMLTIMAYALHRKDEYYD